VEYDFPHGLAMDWDGGAAMRDVAQWLRLEGDRIVLVYGGVDPWTGGAIDVGSNPRVLTVVQPGGDHQTRIQNLDAAYRAQVLSALESWLGMDLSAAPARGIVVPPPEADPALRAGPMALMR
jgi:hypothetical protein